MCPLCREEYADDDIDCLGPWDEQDNLGSRADGYEQQQHEEEDWAPNHQEREEDREAWNQFQQGAWHGDNKDDDESGYAGDWEDDLPEDENVRGYAREWIGLDDSIHHEQPRGGPEWTNVDRQQEGEWIPSDDAYEEDRAAWEELQRQQEWLRG